RVLIRLTCSRWEFRCRERSTTSKRGSTSSNSYSRACDRCQAFSLLRWEAHLRLQVFPRGRVLPLKAARPYLRQSSQLQTYGSSIRTTLVPWELLFSGAEISTNGKFRNVLTL